MSILALISNGTVENVIVGDAAHFPSAVDVSEVSPRPSIGWTYNGAAFTPPVATESPAPAKEPRHITNLAFDLRFTAAERVTIELASMDDPTASMEQRQQAAFIRVGLQRANKASYINLDDPVTRSNVEQFEQYGLIGEGRAVAILDADIDPHERP